MCKSMQLSIRAFTKDSSPSQTLFLPTVRLYNHLPLKFVSEVTDKYWSIVVHVSYFGLISEMEEPRDFPKSLALLQVIDTALYLVTAVVTYRYFGPGISSPAPSSAGKVMKRVAYGIALPTVSPMSGMQAIKKKKKNIADTRIVYRSSSLELYMVMWPASTYTCGFSAGRRGCMRKICCPSVSCHGWAWVRPCG